MARICSFLLLAVFAIVTSSVLCKDVQRFGLNRKSFSKLNSKFMSANRATTLRSHGGEILNNIGK